MHNQMLLTPKFRHLLGVVPVLDSFPGARAAYSLRKVRSNYTGPLIQVISQSGTKDFYPVNGEISEQEVIDWVGYQNLLAYSEDYTNSVWLKENITITQNLPDPLGGNRALSIYPTTANAGHRIVGNTMTFSTSVIPSVYVKSLGHRYIQFGIGTITNVPSVEERYITVDLIDKKLITGTPNNSVIIETLPNDWLRISFTMVTPSSSVSNRININLWSDTLETMFAGDPTKGIMVHGWQINNNVLQPYQQTVGAVTRTGNGAVITWYDQTGNGFDATQTSADRRPYIMLDGVISKRDNKLGVRFIDRNGTTLVGLPLPTRWYEPADQQVWSFIAATVNDIPSYTGGWLLGSGWERASFSVSLATTSYDPWTRTMRGTGQTYGPATQPAPVNNKMHIRVDNANRTTTSINQWINTGNAATASDVNQDFYSAGNQILTWLGGTSSNANIYDIILHEVLLYNTDQTSNRISIQRNLNSFYKLYWDGTKSGLLDNYAGAQAAFSLRALNSSYLGPLVRIRRGSDNAELDIYATYDGDLDTRAIEIFCANTDGFVRTWYDQSLNGRNATQTNTAEQPLIAISGVVVLENGKPAIRFGRSSVTRLATTAFQVGQSFSFIRVMDNYAPTASTNYDILGENTGTNYAGGIHIWGTENNQYVPYWCLQAAGQQFIPTWDQNQSSLLEGQRIIAAYREATTSTKSYKITNNDLTQYEGVVQDVTWLDVNSIKVIGTLVTSSLQYFNGTTQEWILWSDSNHTVFDNLITEVNTYYKSFDDAPAYNKENYTISDMQTFQGYLYRNLKYRFDFTVATLANPNLPAYEHLSGCFANDNCIYLPPFFGTRIGKYNVATNTYTAVITDIGTYNTPKYNSGVYYPKTNKIYFVPGVASWPIKVFDVATQTTIDLDRSAFTGGWLGGILAGNNMIYFIPSASNTPVLKINPENNQLTAINTSVSGYAGGVLATNGMIYCIPQTALRVLEINPYTDTTQEIGSTFASGLKWSSGVLAPNGKIYCIPYRATRFMEIDPISKTTNLVGTDISVSHPEAFTAGALGPDGMIYACPHTHQYFGRFDPNTYTLTNVFPSVTTASNKYWGLFSYKDGYMYSVPYGQQLPFRVVRYSYNNSNEVVIRGLSENFYLSRHFNKF